MPQLVTRVDDHLVAAIDAMVDSGMVASRSDAVRLALTRFVDQQTRADIGARIARRVEFASAAKVSSSRASSSVTLAIWASL